MSYRYCLQEAECFLNEDLHRKETLGNRKQWDRNPDLSNHHSKMVTCASLSKA